MAVLIDTSALTPEVAPQGIPQDYQSIQSSPDTFGAGLGRSMMQAGSELAWNMSGPIFAGNHDSSPYSNLNVVTVGLRGSCIPFLGAWLCAWGGASSTMIAGAVFCVLASAWMAYCSRQDQVRIQA